MGTIHLKKGRTEFTSLCGVTHPNILTTTDISKITCPQCSRLKANASTLRKRKSRGK